MWSEAESKHIQDVLHACAACLIAIDEPHHELDTSNDPGQADYGLPGKQRDCHWQQSDYRDYEQLVVMNLT
jgi:hypothetical protein